MMSRNFTPEQTLIDKIASGDGASLEELTRRYGYSLYSYSLSKLGSHDDARRIVRNIFISLWESRHLLPEDFSVSTHLYTEVRKAVVQCLNNKLRTSTDVLAIEQNIIPGFSLAELSKAKQPVDHTNYQKSRYYFSDVKKRNYEEQWWGRFIPAVNLNDLKHSLKSMLNMW